MKAVMLVAGIGKRLGPNHNHRPKVLLSFGGKSLLRRHLEILDQVGVGELVLVTGFQAEAIEAELAAAPGSVAVSTVHNPDYTEGSVVSLWCAREALAGGGDVVLMDGDVLYDHRLMARLLAASHATCFAMDREFEAGDEPVKICRRAGRLVDFHKMPVAEYDEAGEWVGFLRLSSAGARSLLEAARAYIEAGRRETPYEEAIRDALLADPEAFGVVDVTGLPWIEIDFPDDVQRAEDEILPRIEEPAP
jgi:choline kinase